MYNKIRSLFNRLGGFYGNKSRARKTKQQDTRVRARRAKAGSTSKQVPKLLLQKKTSRSRKNNNSGKTKSNKRTK